MSTMTNLTFILFLCCIFGVQNSLCKLQLNKSVKATFIRHFNSKSNSNSCVGEGYTCYNDSDCCSYSCNFNSCSCGTIGSYCLNDHSCCSYSCDLSICCSISDCTNDTDCCNRDSHFCINGFCQCKPNGFGCNYDGECCLGICTNHLCQLIDYNSPENFSNSKFPYYIIYIIVVVFSILLCACIVCIICIRRRRLAQHRQAPSQYVSNQNTINFAPNSASAQVFAQSVISYPVATGVNSPYPVSTNMNAIPPPSNVSYPTQVSTQPTIYPYVVNPAQEPYRPPYSAPSAPEASPTTYESVPAFVYNQSRPMEPPPEYKP